MSFINYITIFLVLAYTSSSLATYGYGKPKPKKYIVKMKIGRYAIAGPCSCFEKRVACPNNWTPRQRSHCSQLDRWEDPDTWARRASATGQLQGIGGSSVWSAITGSSAGSSSGSYSSYSSYGKYGKYGKKVKKIKKVLVEHISCCPPLRFFFYEYPSYLEASDASEIPEVPVK